MRLIIIFSMAFSLLIAFFAVQNSAIVTVRFLWYSYSLSEAVVIIGSCLIGILIMIPFDIFRSLKNKLKIYELNNEIKGLKNLLNSSSSKNDRLEKSLANASNTTSNSVEKNQQK